MNSNQFDESKVNRDRGKFAHKSHAEAHIGPGGVDLMAHGVEPSDGTFLPVEEERDEYANAVHMAGVHLAKADADGQGMNNKAYGDIEAETVALFNRFRQGLPAGEPGDIVVEAERWADDHYDDLTTDRASRNALSDDLAESAHGGPNGVDVAQSKAARDHFIRRAIDAATVVHAYEQSGPGAVTMAAYSHGVINAACHKAAYFAGRDGNSWQGSREDALAQWVRDEGKRRAADPKREDYYAGPELADRAWDEGVIEPEMDALGL